MSYSEAPIRSAAGPDVRVRFSWRRLLVRRSAATDHAEGAGTSSPAEERLGNGALHPLALLRRILERQEATGGESDRGPPTDDSPRDVETSETTSARDRARLWRWHAAWLGVLTLGAMVLGYVTTRTGSAADPPHRADAVTIAAPPTAEPAASSPMATRLAADPLPDVPEPPAEAVDRSASGRSDQSGGANAPELTPGAPAPSPALAAEPPIAPLSPPPAMASARPATPEQPFDDRPLLEGRERRLEAPKAAAPLHGAVKAAAATPRAVGTARKMPSTAARAPAVASTGAATPSSSPLIQQRYRVISALSDTAWIVDLERPGMALLEIHLNDQVPEIGRIRSISSDGVHWVVATDHGVIRSGDD